MTPNTGAAKEGAGASSSAERFNYRHPGSTAPENGQRFLEEHLMTTYKYNHVNIYPEQTTHANDR